MYFMYYMYVSLLYMLLKTKIFVQFKHKMCIVFLSEN